MSAQIYPFERHVGRPTNRVDGPAKVTGRARYAAEYDAPDLLHGVVLSSTVARGRVRAIDTAEARSISGVVEIYTHENSPRSARSSQAYHDQVAPPGTPLRPLQSDEVPFNGAPVALVLAETLEAARAAAALVRVEYRTEAPETDLAAKRGASYEPPKKRDGIKPPPKPRGDAPGAFAAAPVRHYGEYSHAIEHHNPMEPHASTVIWEGDGRLTVYDKVQGSQNSQAYLASVFGLPEDSVRVMNPYVGGAFGSGLRPQYQLYLATMAALALKRSVKVALTRSQMWTLGYRPHTLQTVKLGADSDGALLALEHDAVAGTSRYEDYQENVVNWSGFLYGCPNVALGYELVKVDTPTPADMRAPGAVTGVFALEVAMDELAHELGLDPLELRLRNYSTRDANEDKPYGSKELAECYRQGAERFGWSKRSPAPRSMRDGRELVGYGVATGVWEALMMKTSARATFTVDGRLTIACATSDIGTGTYTILAQIAADALGLPIEAVEVRIGDSTLPTSPVEGGSWTAASAGSAVADACDRLRDTLLGFARGIDGSPLANAAANHVVFRDGTIALAADPSRAVPLVDALRAGGVTLVEAEETAEPDAERDKRIADFTHSAVFAEVRIDEELGVIRVARVVSAIAAGRVLNPKTARSQIVGGIVMGLGMALEEESMLDHNLGRFMNRNLGEYHIPVHADMGEIDVIFVHEETDANRLGVKGMGEIGIVGAAAAIANAVFHATGRRVRDLPITLDKLL